MKNSKIALAFLVGAFMLLFSSSCTKSDELVAEKSIQITEPVDFRSVSSTTIQIRCRGNCGNPSGGGDQCGMIHDVINDIVKCVCETGCSMFLSNYSSTMGGGIQQSLAKTITFFKTSTPEGTIIDHISLTVDVENLTEIITYTYKNNNEEALTKTYLLEYTQNNDNSFSSVGPTWEIDCRGHCNPGSTDRCVEEWHASTGKVQCGCESDNCKMYITEPNK